MFQTTFVVLITGGQSSPHIIWGYLKLIIYKEKSLYSLHLKSKNITKYQFSSLVRILAFHSQSEFSTFKMEGTRLLEWSWHISLSFSLINRDTNYWTINLGQDLLALGWDKVYLNVGSEIRTRLKSEWKVKMCKHRKYKTIQKRSMENLIYKCVLCISTKYIIIDKTNNKGIFNDINTRYAVRYYTLFIC